MAELGEEQFAAAVATWRERMRAHADASYVQLIVNEGGGAGASLEHSHAQLYALPFVPAAVARERERAGAYGERTAGGGLLSDVLVEEVRRRERLVAIDDEAALICPWASRSPFELRVIPRRESGALRGGRGRRGDDPHRDARPRRPLRRAAGAEPLGPHRPPRRRAVPLARRHRPAADDQGRLRARHRRRHQHLPAGAGGRATCAKPWETRAADDAEPATDPALHRRHHPGGDPARPLRRAAARGLRARPARRSRTCPSGAALPAEVDWFPERAWGGRVWVPCSAHTESAEGKLELFGHVSYVLPPGGEPADFQAKADFTDVLAEDNPDWRIDLNDDVIGRWRGENGRAGAVTLVWGRPLVRGAVAATAELDAETVDQEEISQDRFTLIALDALEGYGDEIFMEVKLWSRRAHGARLREPLQLAAGSTMGLYRPR